MSKSLHDLVIGGTRGIGRALVRLWAQQGHAVSVIGRREAPGMDRQLSGVRYWAVDLTDQERLAVVLSEILADRGPLNAAAFLQRFRGEREADVWAGEFATSLTATKQVIEHIATAFDETGGKGITIVSSVAQHLIADEQPLSYHVAKAALSHMVRYYAVTLGSQGVRVNGVCPGTVLKEEAREFYRHQEGLGDLYRRIIPLGRMGTSEDIAQVVAFLCSAQAAFVTGQNLVVDGGLSLQWQESLARKLMVMDMVAITRKPVPERP